MLKITWHDPSPVQGPSSRVATRCTPTKVRFTPDEDNFIKNLKSEGLRWREICRRYREAFGRGRSLGALRTRYCTKLARRERTTVNGHRWVSLKLVGRAQGIYCPLSLPIALLLSLTAETMRCGTFLRFSFLFKSRSPLTLSSTDLTFLKSFIVGYFPRPKAPSEDERVPWQDTPMDGSLPSCILEDFKRPRLRQCRLERESMSFTHRMNPKPNYTTNDGLDGGADGYNWAVRFQEGGPEFVLKVVSSLQTPSLLTSSTLLYSSRMCLRNLTAMLLSDGNAKMLLCSR